MHHTSERTKSKVLLTVSGEVDPDIDRSIAAGERPRADYLEMARAFGADLIDYTKSMRDGSGVARVMRALAGKNVMLAYECWRNRASYDVIFTDGEQVGIPLAILLKFLGRGPRRTQHLMIVHTLSVRKKELFFDFLRIHSHVDRFLVYSSWQKRFIESRWSVSPDAVIFTPFMVDDEFFSLKREPKRDENAPPRGRGPRTICAVGLERRDYPTLMEAVRGLPVKVVVAAASPWSKQDDSTEGADIPDNVVVRKFSQLELRSVYAESAFMVMPLLEVSFQAGVTAILEAMAMERAVICSKTPGQTDVIVDGVNGLYVAAQDVVALRSAIEGLLQHPAESERLGRNGRRLVEEQMKLDCYVQRLASVVQSACAEPANG